MHAKRLSGSYWGVGLVIIAGWFPHSGASISRVLTPRRQRVWRSDNEEKSTIHTSSATLSSTSLRFRILHISNFLISNGMGSDTLLPETRVLAIASHVRVMCAFVVQLSQLTKDR
jgi:hypothetical protein